MIILHFHLQLQFNELFHILYLINPYIVIDFLKDCQQRVCVDNVMAPFLPVNRGMPKGTVLGPVPFTIMVNDISPTSQNTL